jgi:hypothetical protein
MSLDSKVTTYPVTVRVENQFAEQDTKDIDLVVIDPTIAAISRIGLPVRLILGYPFLNDTPTVRVTHGFRAGTGFPPDIYTSELRFYNSSDILIYTSSVETEISNSSSYNTMHEFNWDIPVNILFVANYFRIFTTIRGSGAPFGYDDNYLLLNGLSINFSDNYPTSDTVSRRWDLLEILTNPLIETNTVVGGGGADVNLTSIQLTIDNSVNTVNNILSVNKYQFLSSPSLNKTFYKNLDDTGALIISEANKTLIAATHINDTVYEADATTVTKSTIISQTLSQDWSLDITGATKAELILSNDGDRLILSVDTFTKVYNTTDMTELLSVNTFSEGGSISDDNQYAAICSDDSSGLGGVYLLSNQSRPLQLDNTTHSTFYKDGSKVIFATDEIDPLNTVINIYETAGWTLESTIQVSRRITSMKVDKTNSYLLVGYDSGSDPIQVFNLSDLSLNIPGQSIPSDVKISGNFDTIPR